MVAAAARDLTAAAVAAAVAARGSGGGGGGGSEGGGEGGATTVDWPGSRQELALGALLASPLYDATQRYVPACVGVNSADWTAPPSTG